MTGITKDNGKGLFEFGFASKGRRVVLGMGRPSPT